MENKALVVVQLQGFYEANVHQHSSVELGWHGLKQRENTILLKTPPIFINRSTAILQPFKIGLLIMIELLNDGGSFTRKMAAE